MSSGLKAYILDLDGVVTRTAELHKQAWRQLFNELQLRFDIDRDYLLYVDGRPRQDGARAFLESRGLHWAAARLQELGRRKDELFGALLEKNGVEVFPDAVVALKAWRRLGLKTAVASSSKNCEKILRAAGLCELFDARVDGTHLEKWKMPGKPAPDMFLAAARMLGVRPRDAAVIEDALSGVQAARAGRFGLVVGVARFGHPELLERGGADVIVSKLTDLLPASLLRAG